MKIMYTRRIVHSNKLFSSIQITSTDLQLALFPLPGPAGVLSHTHSPACVYSTSAWSWFYCVVCAALDSCFCQWTLLPCSSVICECSVLWAVSCFWSSRNTRKVIFISDSLRFILENFEPYLSSLSVHSCLSLNSESAGMSGRQGQRRIGIIIIRNPCSLGQEIKVAFTPCSFSSPYLPPATVYIVPCEKQDEFERVG